MAEMLLEQGLVDLPDDFAETIRNNPVKRSEVVKLAIQRNLAKMFAQSIGKPEPDADQTRFDVPVGTAVFDTSDVGDDA